MKLLFVHDHIFYKTKDNLVYSGAAYPTYAWDRYFEFFDTIITPLTNNLKSQLAYCTFGCLKKLATF